MLTSCTGIDTYPMGSSCLTPLLSSLQGVAQPMRRKMREMLPDVVAVHDGEDDIRGGILPELEHEALVPGRVERLLDDSRFLLLRPDVDRHIRVGLATEVHLGQALRAFDHHADVAQVGGRRLIANLQSAVLLLWLTRSTDDGGTDVKGNHGKDPVREGDPQHVDAAEPSSLHASEIAFFVRHRLSSAGASNFGHSVEFDRSQLWIPGYHSSVVVSLPVPALGLSLRQPIGSGTASSAI
eukprot:3938343-Rhodomonas_salina.4